MATFIIAMVVTLTMSDPALAQSASGDQPPEEEANLLLEQGLRLWQSGNSPSAWMILRGIPPNTVSGREAHERLRQSDAHYQMCIDYLAEGRGGLARAECERGSDVDWGGPMDPHLYLELGDVYRDRGQRYEAAIFYNKYLLFMIQAGEDMDEGTRDHINGYVQIGEQREGREGREEFVYEPPGTPWWVYVSVVTIVVVILLLVTLVFLRRGQTLTELLEKSPDLHPRIAYAIGCLRHELLKHRLGALGDAVTAMRGGEGLTTEQLEYLRERLFGGESLSSLWRIYLDTFDRLAGQRLRLRRRDREFRRAWLAVRALEALRERFESPNGQVAERLDSVRQQIRHFDGHLKFLAEGLCHSAIDGQLLREAVFSVQGEPRAASVRLDEIRFEEPPPDIHVEVFRTDLLIVLRNLVRNAIIAMGRQEDSRRVLGLQVALRTEPTGDESVLVKVLDTSPERVTTDEIYGRRLDRGLGLVAEAVTRYDGSVFVESSQVDYEKAVVVRFFRALGENA